MTLILQAKVLGAERWEAEEALIAISREKRTIRFINIV